MSSTSSSSSGASNCLRSNAYRVAMSSATRAAAPALPPTVTRPRISVPSMVKNRRFGFSIGERVRAVGGDVGVLVEQVLPRDADVVELDAAVVDAGQPALVVAVRRRHAGQVVAVVVADRHHEAVHAVASRRPA